MAPLASFSLTNFGVIEKKIVDALVSSGENERVVSKNRVAT